VTFQTSGLTLGEFTPPLNEQAQYTLLPLEEAATAIVNERSTLPSMPWSAAYATLACTVEPPLPR
jgi:hypothetical protein